MDPARAMTQAGAQADDAGPVERAHFQAEYVGERRPPLPQARVWRQVARHGKGRRRCACCSRFLGERGTSCRWFPSIAAEVAAHVVAFACQAAMVATVEEAGFTAFDAGGASLLAPGVRQPLLLPDAQGGPRGSDREGSRTQSRTRHCRPRLLSRVAARHRRLRRGWTSASSSPRNASGFPMHPFSRPQVVRSRLRAWSRKRQTNCAWNTACRQTLASRSAPVPGPGALPTRLSRSWLSAATHGPRAAPRLVRSSAREYPE
jgi:hypothetical protein